MSYLINKHANTHFTAGNGQPCNIDMQALETALILTNTKLKKLSKFEVEEDMDIYPTLGMRNLSGFIGETFVKNFVKSSNGMFLKNPHQDGYPDMLLMDVLGRAAYQVIALLNKLRDKAPFSPFQNGGIEVKATCGYVPMPAYYTKRNLLKPDMGDTRIDLMKGYGWSAHHRETTNLIGVFWDFNENRVPQIVALFFGNSINQSDWGNVSVPKVGSRTTNAAGMTRTGVKKMYDNWLIVKDDSRYVDFLNRYNHGNLIGYQTQTDDVQSTHAA